VASLLIVTVAGCQDTVRPGPGRRELDQIAVVYLCGNRFELRNLSPAARVLHYSVAGTQDSGDVVLPAGSETNPSLIELTTLARGPLTVSSDEEEGTPVQNGGSGCPAASGPEPQASTGEWSAPFSWPVVAVHLHLLPSGQVLSWGRIGTPQLFDLASETFLPVPSSTMLFCSGHTFLADGRLLVSGGHLDDRRGLRDANAFDPVTESWTRLEGMSFARWYPTTTMLADGSVLSIAGTDERAVDVETPELWTGNAWRSLDGARRVLPYYPRTFLAPNGLVFYAGELQQSSYLDPSGSGQWIPVAESHYGRRDYGSAVMYQPGKVMIVGGSDPPDGQPTNTAEVIDLNADLPRWSYTGAMRYPRRQLNATLLPDGKVLVTGGTSGAGFSDRTGAVHAAESWDPGTGQWRELAGNQVIRVYHSTTLLLPDGRVLHAGSGDGPGLPRELNAEFFSPPYLFLGRRPLLGTAPGQVEYGQTFDVLTPDATVVVRVTLVRLGSVTHAFDQSQRFAELSFRRVAGGLSVQAPQSSTLAPPGPYLLTLLNDAGVPSESTVMRIR
jgi:hypothetical protein